jgi:hypothetical protein
MTAGVPGQRRSQRKADTSWRNTRYLSAKGKQKLARELTAAHSDGSSFNRLSEDYGVSPKTAK